VIGRLNWYNTTELRPGGLIAIAARAVGVIRYNGGHCTAWLISRNHLVTARHCIGDESEASGARAAFNFEGSQSPFWFDCSTLEDSWEDIDTSVLSCAARDGRYPGDVYGTVQLASSDVPSGTKPPIYAIHQNCTGSGCAPTKKFSPGLVLEARYRSAEMSYDADTRGGSSGAPVFLRDGSDGNRVVALHHIGLSEDGVGIANLGVRASALRPYLAPYLD
jgi:hypothetical protein